MTAKPAFGKTIHEFMSYLRTLDIKLWTDNGRLRYNAPQGAMTPALLDQLRTRKADLLAFLSSVQMSDTIEPIAREGDLPLSFAQQRLWFLDQLEGESASYNMPAALRLDGDLDIAALEKSMNEIVNRHEALRTTFATVNGTARQVITPTLQLSLPVEDLRDLPEAEQDAEVLRLAAEEAKGVFDLAKGPLLRMTLLCLSEQKHVLLITMHHIISDGWSVGVFVREWGLLYKAYLEGAASPLPSLSLQYADFAHWQRTHLEGERLSKQLKYWRKQLAGAPPLLELPTDRLRPAVQSTRGGREQFTVNLDLTNKLKQLSQASGTTLFMTLLSAFGVLLSRITGEEDVLIGSPIANRNRHEIEHLIGCFVNTLVLRLDLSGNPTFKELLERVRKMTLEAYTHQDLPFERLVEHLAPARNLSHAPLFQVMFVLQNAPIGDLNLPGLKITSLKIDHMIADFDLTLFIEDEGAGLNSNWMYSRDLFKEETSTSNDSSMSARTIERMMTHFNVLLEGIAANPDERVQNFALLTEKEQHQLLVEWNNSDKALPADGLACFHQLFEQQVEQTPNAVAAIFEEQQLTYRELNAQANCLAHLLIEKKVGRDVIVVLLMERSLQFLTAVIAIFKAGGAYLPLNIHSPAKRQAQVLQQSQAALLLTEKEVESVLSDVLSEALAEGTGPEILFMDNLSTLEEASALHENLPPRCTPDDLAYVIYTSGSTGLPKGAMVEEKGMLNHLYAKIWDLSLTKDDRIAQTAPQSFDISVWQFLSGLLVGGCVHIFPDEIAGDPVGLLEETEQQEISILEVVPSLMHMMLEEIAQGTSPTLSTLRWLIPTGEALPPPLCRQWFKYYPNIPMVNAYGPTECSDDVTHYVITEPPADEVVNMSIGRPVANMQLYILDRHLQPVPIGVAGELYVGGIGVGRGYLHDPERTAKAFISVDSASLLCKLTEKYNNRLYKTGDKARYLPDGNIEFLGRLDFQVKIRGFRIELGEIEAILGGHAGVGQVAVIVREAQRGGKRLVAYVVPNQEQPLAPSELRRYLIERLPDYMVPSAFVISEYLPLTPNGKIDRKALKEAPLPEQVLISQEVAHVAPRTPTETQVAAIWADVLGAQESPVGIHHNFFELGGHSLLATQVMSRVRKAFQMKLPLRILFEEPTVAGLVQQIERRQQVLVNVQDSGNDSGNGSDPSLEREEIEL